MAGSEDDMFAGVDALLAAVAAGTVLPVPAERLRLRLAAGLTTAHIASALRVDPALVQGWEDGSAVPGPDTAPAYGRLLEGLALRFPAPAPAPAPTPVQTAAAPTPVAGPDRDADGELRRYEPAPCQWCGNPTPYRYGGVPGHLSLIHI